jgi:hypothetical protein
MTLKPPLVVEGAVLMVQEPVSVPDTARVTSQAGNDDDGNMVMEGSLVCWTISRAVLEFRTAEQPGPTPETCMSAPP